jgi:hypothetical protein
MTTSTTQPNANKATRNIKIDGMKGDTDVTKVRGALTGITGVQTHSVKDHAACEAACKAVTTAGYKAHEQTDAKHEAKPKPTIKS